MSCLFSDRRISQSVAGSAGKGWVCPKWMERWQDKSREVRAGFGDDKFSKYNLLARAARATDRLRFYPSSCIDWENDTSRRVYGP